MQEGRRVSIDAIVFPADSEALRVAPKEGDKDYDKFIAFKEGIRTTGLLNSPSVTENEDGTFTIIDGMRRMTAIKQLYAEGTPNESFADGQLWVNIRDEKEEDALELAVMGNTTAVQTPNSNYAKALWKVINARGYTIEQVASRVGQTPEWILKILKLNALPAEAKEALDNKELSVTNAMTLNDLGDDNEILGMLEEAKQLTTKDLSVKVGERKKELKKIKAGGSDTKEFSPSAKLLSKDELTLELKRAETECEADPSDYNRGALDMILRVWQLDEQSVQRARDEWEAKKKKREEDKEKRKKEREAKKTEDAIKFLKEKGIEIPADGDDAE